MGFVRQFREERWMPKHLANKLPWKTLLLREPQAVIATKDDGLLCGYHLEPYDLAGCSEAEQGALMLRLNDAWKRLESWAIWVKSTRIARTTPPPPRYADAFAAALAQEHDDSLTARGLFTQVYAVYLWHRPPPLVKSLAKAVMLGKGHAYLDTKEAQLETFQAESALWTSYLQGCGDLTPMDDAALLTALHRPLCLHPHPVAPPEWPLDLARYLVDYGMYPKRFPPELGLEYDGERQYIRTLSLTPELPPETWVGMLEGLYALPFPFEVSARWISLNRGLANKRLGRMQRDIISARKSFADVALEMRRQQVIEKKNRFADRQEDDIDEMRDLMLSDEFAMGDEVFALVLKHDDLQVLNRQVHAAMAVFQRAGCVVSDLDVTNTEGLIGTQPGSVHADVRTLRWTSMNGAHVHPFYGPWLGEPTIPQLSGGPPLFYGITEATMAFGLSPYVGDLGLVMQVAPFGTGKSFFNNAVAAALTKEDYGGVDITIWDIDGAARCTTLCYGGAWYNLGKGEAPVQALHGLDDPEEFPHIYQWLVNRVQEGLAHAQFGWDPDLGKVLTGALKKLRESQRPRRMIELIYLLSDALKLGNPSAVHLYGDRARDLGRLLPKMMSALEPWAEGGAYGSLTDAPADQLQFSQWTTFELGDLLGREAVYPGYLELLFRRMRQRRHGQPGHYQFNEAWHYFSHPTFLALLKPEIPSWRKQNHSAIFSTQSLDQLKRHELTALLLASCKMRWFGPNSQALDREVQELYRGVELSPDELERFIVRARPTRDWYIVRPKDQGRPRKRLVDFRFPAMCAAVYGAESLHDHDLMDKILEREGPEQFGWHWLREKGFDVTALQAAGRP